MHIENITSFMPLISLLWQTSYVDEMFHREMLLSKAEIHRTICLKETLLTSKLCPRVGSLITPVIYFVYLL